MLRIGLDTTRASPELRAIVENYTNHLTITGPHLGTRQIPYWVLAEDDAEAAWAALQAMPNDALLPWHRLVAGQVTLETRGPLDMMRQATGIETWLVVRGDLAEQYTPTTDGPGTPIAVAA